jgi:hypothetical protein
LNRSGGAGYGESRIERTGLITRFEIAIRAETMGSHPGGCWKPSRVDIF